MFAQDTRLASRIGRRPRASFDDNQSESSGDLGRVRTSDLQLRKLTLYPAELRGHDGCKGLSPSTVAEPQFRVLAFDVLYLSIFSALGLGQLSYEAMMDVRDRN